MKLKILLLILINPFHAFAQKEKINISISPQVELITIMQYLGGDKEEVSEIIPSNYHTAVKRYFGAYKKDTCIIKIAEHYPMFSTIPGIGLHYSGLPEFKQLIPFKASDELITRYGLSHILKLAACSKHFARQSNFLQFFRPFEEESKIWAKQVKDTISKYHLVDYLEEFYGTSKNWNIFLSPLLDWGAFAFIPNESYSKENVTFILGYNDWIEGYTNEINSPRFDNRSSLFNLVWHEGSHSYITPLREKYKAELDKCSGLLDDDLQNKLQKSNSYEWQWDWVVEEHIVRAVVVHLLKKHQGKEAGEKEMNIQVGKGFIYIPEIVDLLEVYEDKKEEFENFGTFFPEVVELFRKLDK